MRSFNPATPTPASDSAILITGLGALTPFGAGAGAFWEALLEGRDGIRDLDLFDPAGYLYRRGGQISSDIMKSLQSRWPSVKDRGALLALAAVEEAVLQAGLGPGDLERTGLLAATNFGGMFRGEQLLAETAGIGAAPDDDAVLDADFGRVNLHIRRMLGLGGVSSVMSLSCSSGAAALARAAGWIRAGRCRRMVVVGYDALSRFAWSGLCALRTMSTDAVRPFDRRRSGTIFSEGAAAIVVEAAPAAAVRGAEPLAELHGWATGNNGTHMTAPSPQGAGSADVMRRAIACAGLRSEDIDHFNAHGTGTVLNDPAEAAALHTVLGARAAYIPTTSIKGAAGHLMGAAGSAEAIAAVLTLRNGMIPPTANHAELDPECALDVVAGVLRPATVQFVLSNSAGIGGTNAAVVLGRPRPGP